jgi:hypothetical protein
MGENKIGASGQNPSVGGFLRSRPFRVMAIVILVVALVYCGFYYSTDAAKLARSDVARSPCAPPSQATVICSASPRIVSPGEVVTIKFAPASTGSPDPKTFRLRLGGQTLSDIAPDWFAPDEVRFRLPEHGEANPNHDAGPSGLAALLGSPPADGLRLVTVGISTPSFDLATAPATDGQARPLVIALRIFRPGLLVPAAGVGLLLAGVIYLARRSDLLRDSRPVAAGQTKPYSLAKCQMAFWFFLITTLFLGVAVITWEYNNIVTTQSLVLLGISGVTGLSAIQIDQTDGKSQTLGPPHVSLLDDLLTDDAGYAFHRIQVLAWTVILGVISIISAYRSLSLPNFDSQLLLLMGISNGLYLGFKFPEAQTPTPPAQGA